MRSHKKILHNGKTWTFNLIFYFEHTCNQFTRSPQNFQNMHNLFEKGTVFLAKDIQQVYYSAQKLAHIKQTNHDIMSFIVESQFHFEELKMFLEADTLEEIQLDKLYIVMTLP